MKPKAMVTMARYGPLTRTAGSASSAPVSVATSAATGSAAQKLHFAARQDRDRVGAERVEADVAEGHLAGEAEQHVEADADDRGDARASP